MSEELKFIKPTMEYEEQAYEYIEEFKRINSKPNGVGDLEFYLGRYAEWLNYLEECSNRRLDDVLFPFEVFMLIRKSDNRLLGIITIRLELNESLLIRGGNIGYSIRPTERLKGYNSYQLYCALEICLEKGICNALLTCASANLASANTIKGAGGLLETEFLDFSTGELVQRYWIDVKEAVEKGQNKYRNRELSTI